MTFFLSSLFIILVFWRPQEWLIPWMFGWPLLDIVVGVACLTLIVEVDSKNLQFPRRNPMIPLLAGLWFATLMSHVAHFYFVGLVETIPETFKVCFFTVLLVCVLERPTRLRTTATIFVVMSGIMAIHALMQQKTGHGFIGQEPLWVIPAGKTAPESRSLFFGIFNDPNDLAQILATTIPLTFVVFRKRNPLTWLVGVALTVLLVAGILATHSRGGMIALATVGSVMVVLWLPMRWQPVTMFLLLCSALALCPLSAAFLDESAHDRVVFWGMANAQFKNNPVFGLGYGMFWQVASDRASHNAFVSCYTTLGLFGYWFWFALLQFAMVAAWRTRVALARPTNEEQDWMRRFAGQCMAAMGGYCASSYFLTRDFVYPLFFLLALLGVLPYVTERLLPPDHPPVIGSGRSLLVAWTLGGLVSITYIYFSIVFLNKAFYG